MVLQLDKKLNSKNTQFYLIKEKGHNLFLLIKVI